MEIEPPTLQKKYYKPLTAAHKITKQQTNHKKTNQKMQKKTEYSLSLLLCTELLFRLFTLRALMFPHSILIGPYTSAGPHSS